MTNEKRVIWEAEQHAKIQKDTVGRMMDKVAYYVYEWDWLMDEIGDVTMSIYMGGAKGFPRSLTDALKKLKDTHTQFWNNHNAKDMVWQAIDKGIIHGSQYIHLCALIDQCETVWCYGRGMCRALALYIDASNYKGLNVDTIGKIYSAVYAEEPYNTHHHAKAFLSDFGL